MTEKGVRVLYGDSQSGIQVVLNPNGPWRSRHLRLRSRALHEAVQQEVWKLKHMAGVELAADFLTKPITVGTTWSGFRMFAGLCDMAKPEDLEILKKIGICREWALKGLTVAVELEKWRPVTESKHRIRKLGSCAVATGICHVVQRWKSHLCCLKRKERTPREYEPGLGKPPTERVWLRENEPSPQPTSKMPRENEPGINPSNGHRQGPTFFGDSGFGESSFGDSVACSFSMWQVRPCEGTCSLHRLRVKRPLPYGLPGFGYRVRALGAGAMDAAPTAAAAAGGAGGDGGEDGGVRPDKSWVEPYNPPWMIHLYEVLGVTHIHDYFLAVFFVRQTDQIHLQSPFLSSLSVYDEGTERGATLLRFGHLCPCRRCKELIPVPCLNWGRTITGSFLPVAFG